MSYANRVKNQDWQVEGTDPQTRAANKRKRDAADYELWWWEQIVKEEPGVVLR